MTVIIKTEIADAALSETTDLVEKLLAAGAINDAERERLLEQFRLERQADCDADARRARVIPTTTYHFGEKAMNANDIVTQIEQTHAVMGAQVRKLNEIAPTPRSTLQTPADGASGLADLLYATVTGHVVNAAESLQAIAGVEKKMRAAMAKSVEAAPIAAHDNRGVVEGEFATVKEVT